MSTSLFIVAVVVLGLLLIAFVSKLGLPVKPKLNKSYFQQQWMELLGKVKTPEGMILAVIEADKLLDSCLKKRHFRGKTMGERLVAAQRELSDNDAAWYAHKLRNRLVHEPNVKLTKSEAQKALAGFRQALKDLGAL